MSFTVNKLKSGELNTIGHYTGYVCILIGLAMIIPIICSLIYHDSSAYTMAFSVSLLISLIVGIFLCRTYKRKSLVSLSLKGSLIFVLEIWGITAFICGLPFFISGDLSLFDAYFEGMSAITTSGLSIHPGPIYANSLRLWESLVEWLGGLGLIILLLVLIPSSIGLKQLYFTEGRMEQITPNLRHTTRIFIQIYLAITVLGLILYTLIGLDPLDAICYTFCSLSTGGFSAIGTNTAIFKVTSVQIVTMILMLLGCTNFILLYKIFKGNYKHFFKNVEIKALYSIIIGATIIISLSLLSNGYYGGDVYYIFKNVLFNVVSIVSTTGFSCISYDTWPALCYDIIIILMILGGCVCSTAGGIKLYNIVILLKSIWWELKEMFLPKNTVILKKVYHNGKYVDVSTKQIKSVLVFVVVYVIVFLISTLVIALVTNDFQLSYILSATALTNAGLAPSYVTINTPILLKLTLIIDFWLGRIGIWPFLLAIVYIADMFSGIGSGSD